MSKVIELFKETKKETESIKETEPRYYIESHLEYFYILDRLWPNIKAGDTKSIHSTSKQNIESVCKTLNKNQPTKYMD